MKKLIFLTSFFLSSLAHAIVFVNNPPGTSTTISSTTLPSGSTNYVQNTLTPTTTTQAFSVQDATVTKAIYLSPGASIYFNSDGTLYKITRNGGNLQLYGGNTQGCVQVDDQGSGNFLPCVSGFQDLGSDTFKWRNLKATSWTAGNGSVQFPNINFSNNTSMGFWSQQNQHIGVTLGNDRTIDWFSQGGTNDKLIQYWAFTSVKNRPVFVENIGWSDSTDATRKGQIKFQVIDTSSQTFMQVNTDGSNAYTTIFGSCTHQGQVVLSSAVFDGSTSAGTSGQVLTSNGAGSAPTWQAGSAGTVYTSTYIYVASKNAGATTVWMTLSTVTVAAGTWTITGQVSLTTAGAIQDFIIAISSISGSSTTGQIDGDNQLSGSFLSGLGDGGAVIANYLVTPAAQTSYYLKQKVNWTIATPSSSSRIYAEKH